MRLACCNSHSIKRADGLIKLPDAFAVLDLDLKIADLCPTLTISWPAPANAF